MQIYFISFNFLYPNQLGGIRQQSTMDTRVFLTHLIRTGWVKGLYTSTLAFDITQFFPSLNHQLLSIILTKAGFNIRISHFFSSYSINRQTQYIWNHSTSPPFNIDISVKQRSILFPILLVLYIIPFFYIFEKRTKNLFVPSSLLSFVNNGQEKSYKKSNVILYSSCCHDLAKWLCHYLYFFSFEFTTQGRSAGKCYMTNVTHHDVIGHIT